MDPYNGIYDNVLSEFVIIGDEWYAKEVFDATLAMLWSPIWRTPTWVYPSR
jgi:hypothetical protein